MLGNDKDVRKQQKVIGLRFCQTMFPTGCIQGPVELGMPCLVFNYIKVPCYMLAFAIKKMSAPLQPSHTFPRHVRHVEIKVIEVSLYAQSHEPIIRVGNLHSCMRDTDQPAVSYCFTFLHRCSAMHSKHFFVEHVEHSVLFLASMAR